MVWSGNGHRQHPFSYPHFLLLDYSKLHVSFIVLEYNKDNIYIKFYYHGHIHSNVLVLCSNYMKILCIFYYFTMIRFHELYIMIHVYVQFFFPFFFLEFCSMIFFLFFSFRIPWFCCEEFYVRVLREYNAHSIVLCFSSMEIVLTFQA